MAPKKQHLVNWRDIENDREKYAAYLCSREWCEKREAVRKRAGGKCERCKVADMNLCHHLTYERKYNERQEDLQALCDLCHAFIHGKSDNDPWKVAPPVIAGYVVRSVYLAGKITGTNWRDDICPLWSHENHGAGCGLSDEDPWDNPYYRGRTGGCILPDGRSVPITGPCWIDKLCGHGTADGNNGQHACGTGKWHNLITNRNYVIGESKKAIDRSSLVFAWIDSGDCFGTLVEIGYAVGRGILTAVATPREGFVDGDMWFAPNFAHGGCYGATPKEAWDSFWNKALRARS